MPLGTQQVSLSVCVFEVLLKHFLTFPFGEAHDSSSVVVIDSFLAEDLCDLGTKSISGSLSLKGDLHLLSLLYCSTTLFGTKCLFNNSSCCLAFNLSQSGQSSCRASLSSTIERDMELSDAKYVLTHSCKTVLLVFCARGLLFSVLTAGVAAADVLVAARMLRFLLSEARFKLIL